MNKYTHSSDSELVALLGEGNERAFEAIYRRYWHKLYQVAYQNIGSQEEAEHIVQEVFTRIWNRREQQNIKEIGVYLVAATKYSAINFIKSQITFRKYQEYLIFQEIQQGDYAENIIYFDDLLDALEAALKQLPEKTADVFKRSRFDNQPNKDIALDLNLTEKAVEYHITKSLKFLRAELQQYQTKN